jgi:IS30 family transposase
MGHYFDSTREASYNQLTFEDRTAIEALLRHRASPKEIAEDRKRHISTIYREIARGSCIQIVGGVEKSAYFAELAQSRHDAARGRSSGKSKFEAAHAFVEEIDKGMAEMREGGIKCGPDGFVGKLAASGRYSPKDSVCTKTVYTYIKAGLMGTKATDLPRMLRNRKRKAKGAAKPRENRRVYGESIESRPAEANFREELGHGEGDLAEGRKGCADEAILVLAERKARIYIARKIAGTDAKSAEEGFRAILEENGPKAFKSCTWDNGSEFSGMDSLCAEYGVQAYFCHPYSSWEKGCVERHNGILRLAIPKGTKISALGMGRLEAAELSANALPRRLLGYRAPEDLFEEEMDRLYSAGS